MKACVGVLRADRLRRQSPGKDDTMRREQYEFSDRS